MRVASRYWRSYGDDPLPSAEEALAQPLCAFPSWFFRMECERCGRERYLSQVHLPEIWEEAPVYEIVTRLEHEGCGGRPKLVELISGIDGLNGGKPVRRIRLVG